MDLVLSKRRMIEIYLTLWNGLPGLWGRGRFPVSFQETRPKLTKREAAFLPPFCQVHQTTGWKALKSFLHRQPHYVADEWHGLLSRLSWP